MKSGWRDVTGLDPAQLQPTAFARLDFQDDFSPDGASERSSPDREVKREEGRPKQAQVKAEESSDADKRRFSYFIHSLSVVIGRVPPKNNKVQAHGSFVGSAKNKADTMAMDSPEIEAEVDLGSYKNISRRHLQIAYDLGLSTWMATVLSQKNAVSFDGEWFAYEAVVPLKSGTEIVIATRKFFFHPQQTDGDQALENVKAKLELLSNPLLISEPDVGGTGTKARSKVGELGLDAFEYMAPRASKLKAAAVVSQNQNAQSEKPDKSKDIKRLIPEKSADDTIEDIQISKPKPKPKPKPDSFPAHPLLRRKKTYDKHYRASDSDPVPPKPTGSYAAMIQSMLEEAQEERIRIWRDELGATYQPSGSYAKPETTAAQWPKSDSLSYPPLLSRKTHDGKQVYVKARLTLQEMTDILVARHEWYRENRVPNWQSSLKTALNANTLFLKLDEGGTRTAWCIDPSYTPSTHKITKKLDVNSTPLRTSPAPAPTSNKTPPIRIEDRPEFSDALRYILADGFLYLTPIVFGTFTPAQVQQIQGLNMDGTKYLLDTYIARFNTKAGIKAPPALATIPTAARPSMTKSYQSPSKSQSSLSPKPEDAPNQSQALASLPEELRLGIEEALRKNDLETLYSLYARVDQLKKAKEEPKMKKVKR